MVCHDWLLLPERLELKQVMNEQRAGPRRCACLSRTRLYRAWKRNLMRRFAAARYKKALKSRISVITKLGSSMAEAVKKPRPEFRNIGIGQLAKYRLPLAGKVSILHRISGLLLFISLPFLLYLLDQSLTSELSFDAFKGFLANPIVKIITLVLSWAFLFTSAPASDFSARHPRRGEQGRRQADRAHRADRLVAAHASRLRCKLFGAF